MSMGKVDIRAKAENEKYSYAMRWNAKKGLCQSLMYNKCAQDVQY